MTQSGHRNHKVLAVLRLIKTKKWPQKAKSKTKELVSSCPSPPGALSVPDWDLHLIEQAFADAAVNPSRWDEAMKVVSEVTGSDNAALLPIDGPVPAHYQKFPGAETQRVAAVLLAAGTDQWILSVQRSIAQIPFLPNERREIAKLSSSLSTAAALARTLGFSAAKIALEAFELSGIPIVLLNRAGEPIELNRQAEALLGTGISISKKRLRSCGQIHAFPWRVIRNRMAQPK